MSFTPRTAVLFTLSVLIASFALAGDGQYPGGLRPPLGEVLEQADPSERIPVSIVLREQASLESIRLATAGLRGDEARGAALALLKRTAASHQGPLLDTLRIEQASGRIARLRPLWIGNVIGVDATPDLIRRIAARPEVAWVNHNPKVNVELGHEPADDLQAALPTGPLGVSAIECGVEQMDAPRVWNELGTTGEGVVVAVIDSGVCWSHSDIVNQVWVNPGEDLDGDGEVMDPDDENGIDDDGNGFVDDLVGWDFDQGDNRPSDDNSHGSHCAGTVAGDGTAGTQSGMAPDAEIMIIRVGLTFSDEVDVWNAMQYAAENGADAISMSLGWPHSNNPDRATWRQNAENTIEAGTAMIIAAGNEGSGNDPDNVRTPGDVPRIISVGAVDCDEDAAGFSSRGPVSWQNVAPFNDHPYPPGLIKPDVSAPGVSTASHNICTGYSLKSGTSMATPHVAGAVALMKSVNPGLTHDEIKNALELTSIDRGAPGKDNTYGSGRVDAFAAVQEVFGLRLEEVEIVDNDPNYGNADGGVDTGELVTLAVTLRNQRDDLTSTNVRAHIETTTPGVTLVHDYATWDDIAPLGTAVSHAPHFSVRIENGCNYRVDFTMTLEYDDRVTSSRFSIRVGSAFDRLLMADDFESDQGWTASATASSGGFVLEDPVGVTNAGNVVQPEDDVTPDPGSVCWVTGNGSTVPGDGDVDGGSAFVVSPPMDATDFDNATLSFWRFFHAVPGTVPASDFFRVQWSRDGSNWNTIDEIGEGHPWQQVELPLPNSAFGPDLQIRFEVADDPLVIIDSVVEGLVDEVMLDGQRIECDSFSASGSGNPPNPVGNSLLVNLDANGDLRLDWQEPAADASHDPATLYRVFTSGTPDVGFGEAGQSQAPFHVDAGGDPSTLFYLVAAENAAGDSGEMP